MFPLRTITREHFFAKYWRKEPLYVPGGAVALKEACLELPFEEAVLLIEAIEPNLVRRGKEDVIFAQRLNRVSPRLRAISSQLRRNLSWTTTWFDGVLTRGGGTVGCHWDATDNFVIQQSGIKLWRVFEPIPTLAQQYHEALLGHPVDSALIPPASAFLECVLAPGDLLYIPMFWPHHGVAEDASLSYSLVVGPESSLSLLSLLYWILEEEQVWRLPLPIPNVVGAMGETLPISEEFSNHVERLIAVLCSDNVRRRLIAEWWNSRGSEVLSD